MVRLTVVFLTSLLSAAAQTTHIQFQTVPRAIVEERLRSVESTNLKREQKLLEMFRDVGCTGENLVEQPVKHASTPNVICTLPGSSAEVILVGAHLDFVNTGAGIVDNWSGCSLLPSLYASVKSFPRRHTYVFVGFADEEIGLVGSKFYVHQLKKEALAKIQAMVNLDSLGLTPTKMEAIRGSDLLLKHLYSVAVNSHLPISVVDVHKVGLSDSDSFEDKKVPTINIHSVTTETFPILHTKRDQLDVIDMDQYYDSYQLLRSYLAFLDVKLAAAGN